MPPSTEPICSTWTTLIANPGAGNGQAIDELRQRINDCSRVLVVQTRRPGDATRLAHAVAQTGGQRIIVAGGDGTVHAVVNGVLTAPDRCDALTIGVVPLGTGNDLARTLGIPLDPIEALKLIDHGESRRFDVFRVRFGRHRFFGCNVAAGGFTGQMNEIMTDELKQTWGPLAYLRGAMKVVPDLTAYHTTIRYDSTAPEEVPAMNVIVANARTAGGGTTVAPDADPEDGLLDVVVVRRGTLRELSGVAARLFAGDYTQSDLVTHRRARRVEIRSTPGMWFNVDGELVTNEPITFTAIPRAVRFITGPQYARTVR